LAKKIPDASVQEKVTRAIALLQKTYYDNSEISGIVKTKDFNVDEEGFLQLGSKIYIPKEWFTRNDIFYDIAVEQFARNLVISETKYLLTRISDCKEIRTIPLEENLLESFISHFKQFSEMNRVQAIFAPIDLYVKMHIDWPASSADIRLDFRSGELTICGEKPRIFWSSNYTPFSHFIFVNKSFGEWIAKPAFDNRLSVSITPSNKEDKLSLLFLTIFKFEITSPEKLLILSTNVQ